MMSVSDALTMCAGTPAIVTLVTPVSEDPSISYQPGLPYGSTSVMVGLRTVNFEVVSTSPREFATLILPLVAPTGTVARIWASESTITTQASIPLN